ncbi:hypothetical protein JMG10_00690 [Nostoc ellipsosporum NOK]|nr:hypothetical protein [Nostoc ellipsosporum NOK]
MANRKPVILLCFGYHRKGWIEIFEKLNDVFEFHYLFWVYPEMELASYTDCPKHYWADYRNAQDLLNKIRPEKVVMMGTESLLNLALLFTCRRRKIPTYVMQHGLFHDLKTNILIDRELMKNKVGGEEKKEETMEVRKHIIPFFLKSLRPGDFFNLFRIAKWQLNRRKMLDLEALALNRHPYQQADFYIVYSKFNGKYFTEVDGPGEEKMLEIGIPEFDAYFSYKQTAPAAHPYNVLIDSALTYNKEYKTMGLVSQDSYNAFLGSMNNISIRQGRKLYVKLHPFCYDNDQFLQHENITYFRDCDIVDMIMRADGIIGFNSTLMIPALYYKPAVLFRYQEHSYLEDAAVKYGFGRVHDYYDYSEETVYGDLQETASDKRKRILEKLFIYKADGQTAERLKEVLLN